MSIRVLCVDAGAGVRRVEGVWRGLDSEAVWVRNDGPSTVDLGGYVLAGRAGLRAQMPARRLGPGAVLRVGGGVGDSNFGNLAPLWLHPQVPVEVLAPDRDPARLAGSERLSLVRERARTLTVRARQGLDAQKTVFEAVGTEAHLLESEFVSNRRALFERLGRRGIELALGPNSSETTSNGDEWIRSASDPERRPGAFMELREGLARLPEQDPSLRALLVALGQMQEPPAWKRLTELGRAQVALVSDIDDLMIDLTLVIDESRDASVLLECEPTTFHSVVDLLEVVCALVADLAVWQQVALQARQAADASAAEAREAHTRAVEQMRSAEQALADADRKQESKEAAIRQTAEELGRLGRNGDAVRVWEGLVRTMERWEADRQPLVDADDRATEAKWAAARNVTDAENRATAARRRQEDVDRLRDRAVDQLIHLLGQIEALLETLAPCIDCCDLLRAIAALERLNVLLEGERTAQRVRAADWRDAARAARDEAEDAVRRSTAATDTMEAAQRERDLAQSKIVKVAERIARSHSGITVGGPPLAGIPGHRGAIGIGETWIYFADDAASDAYLSADASLHGALRTLSHEVRDAERRIEAARLQAKEAEATHRAALENQRAAEQRAAEWDAAEARLAQLSATIEAALAALRKALDACKTSVQADHDATESARQRARDLLAELERVRASLAEVRDGMVRRLGDPATEVPDPHGLIANEVQRLKDRAASLEAMQRMLEGRLADLDAVLDAAHAFVDAPPPPGHPCATPRNARARRKEAEDLVETMEREKKQTGEDEDNAEDEIDDFDEAAGDVVRGSEDLPERMRVHARSNLPCVRLDSAEDAADLIRVRYRITTRGDGTHYITYVFDWTFSVLSWGNVILIAGGTGLALGTLLGSISKGSLAPLGLAGGVVLGLGVGLYLRHITDHRWDFEPVVVEKDKDWAALAWAWDGGHYAVARLELGDRGDSYRLFVHSSTHQLSVEAKDGDGCLDLADRLVPLEEDVGADPAALDGRTAQDGGIPVDLAAIEALVNPLFRASSDQPPLSLKDAFHEPWKLFSPAAVDYFDDY